ncbi:hypothetical protein [Sulfuricurvum sp.]|uniref:hypothetical protein n=1 Tax=Sulfuricurvum sp. TaxID=2025608 RepID=UPI002613C55A|nr:hypothetical protein [Sulfuricurvum sp.]MDD4949952.1 hypothetical protein [Sulfuricurvum sp.]
MKKIFWAVLSSAVMSFMLTGCMTTKLWQDDKGITSSKYQDTITAFMMTEDGKNIIFASSQYHYIMKSDAALVFLLSHKSEIPVHYQFSKDSYSVFTNNQIQAVFSASFNSNDIAPSLLQDFNDHRYGRTNTKTNQVDIDFHLSGNRYQSDPKINALMTSLQQPIEFTFTEFHPRSSGEKIASTLGKIAVTPITVAADGVLIVFGAAVIVVRVEAERYGRYGTYH